MKPHIRWYPSLRAWICADKIMKAVGRSPKESFKIWEMLKTKGKKD